MTMRLKAWKWREEPRADRKPPFDLKDHDGPSMLWMNAQVLEERYELPGHAERLRELAIKWAQDRGPPMSRGLSIKPLSWYHMPPVHDLEYADTPFKIKFVVYQRARDDKWWWEFGQEESGCGWDTQGEARADAARYWIGCVIETLS
jgi:hypothetical protein